MKILICLTLLLVVGSTQNWAVDFLSGIHYSMGVQINPYIIPYLTPSSLNYSGLSTAYGLVQYTSQQYRDAAIANFRDVFYTFSVNLYNILKIDPAFSLVLNYTLTVLWNPNEFAYRANLFRTLTGRDAYADLWYFSGGAFIKNDFSNAGFNFGSIILKLKQIYSLDGPQNEPVLRSLLFPDRDYKRPISKDLNKDLTRNLSKDLTKSQTKDLNLD